ncbi:MAG: serine/threonine protein kinase [bacterium]
MSTPAAQKKKAKELFGYRVRKVIGDGAWSRVYEVEDTKTHTAYALKHVISDGEKEERYLEQLRAEWRVGKALNHPAIRKLVALEGEGLLSKLFRAKSNELGLVMELIDAPPLSEHVNRGTRPSMPECLRIFLDVASGLLHMHSKGFVHADMKPLNILYDADRRMTKIIDLGQAVDIGTQKVRLQGSPGYISPEQATEVKERLFAPVTEKTDVFNFGATMYAILAGGKFAPQSQHTSDKRIRIEPEHLGPRELMSIGDPEIKRDLSDLVSKCLVFEGAGRLPMEKVVRALQALQQQ